MLGVEEEPRDIDDGAGADAEHDPEVETAEEFLKTRYE